MEQVTLGQLIAALEGCDPTHSVEFDFCQFVPTDFDSYRGYYEQLAIGYEEHGTTTVAELLAGAKDALGSDFQGYKGGTFRMHAGTPIWVSNYGRCHSTAITGLIADGYSVILTTGHKP